MDEFEKLKEQIHENTLEDELTRLRWKRDNDDSFSLEVLKNMIAAEIRLQDEGARDRGDLHHIEKQARLAAMEILYHEWKKEPGATC